MEATLDATALALHFGNGRVPSLRSRFFPLVTDEFLASLFDLFPYLVTPPVYLSTLIDVIDPDLCYQPNKAENTKRKFNFIIVIYFFIRNFCTFSFSIDTILILMYHQSQFFPLTFKSEILFFFKEITLFFIPFTW